MKPYYEHAGITIYHGDAREILPHIPVLSAESIITDPIWPNSVFADVNPQELLREALQDAPGLRCVIHLGCDSDPRFLSAVPKRWPFFRVCWLDYARPSYKGRLLYGSEVAYVFGEPPAPKPGAMVLPGKVMAQRTGDNIQRETGAPSSANKNFSRAEHPIDRKRAHPCPRRIQHVQWLVKWFGGGCIVDPFVGSGTTLLAAKKLGVPAIGIEIEEKYCEIAVKRLSQEVLDFSGKQP
ncbi:MAG: DNA methyltransferase [Candidatus Acidiferrum sp.]